MVIVIVDCPQFLSNRHPFEVEREFYDHLWELVYDGEGDVAWPKHLDDFHAFIENFEGFDEVEVSMLLAHTLREYTLLWCHEMPPNCVHSFKKFNDLIENVFHHFYLEAIDKKM